MFKATIDAYLLKDSIETLSVLVDEARFRISPEGIAVRAVDPANVAMVSFDLATDAFEDFSGDDCELGLDLSRVTDILAVADRDDKVHMELDEDAKKLMIQIGGFSYTLSLLDPSTIRAEPRIPQLELPAEIVLNGKDLQKAVKAAEKISDHMLLGVEGENFFMEAEGDTDRVKLTMSRDQLIDIKANDTRSLFSLDYLSDIIKPASKSNEVTLHLGKDFPIKINFSIANGAGTIGYLLAPRIESD
ncbi:monomeric archaeal DNA polymerase sliding clamp [Methanococcoides vulcani]|uniref:DNA polymerase sliding clamp n=1 Tax=Methanococcoides vulcani TaxID=1353158 RepID=A0A1H9ZDE7_9EURY|nr:DNA polymerase sliding clamp [Methanococcoides vulcani]SES79662.1 monomeric archaeal DNA polymerase sliding clamp [Methanococcoides vulcani]